MGISVQVLAERVLNSIPEGIAIAAFAWLLLKLTKQNSGTRFAVWFVSLVTIAAAPFMPRMHGSVARAAHAEIALPGEWAVIILCAWSLVSFFGLTRILFGLIRLRALRNRSLAVSANELPAEVRGTLSECQERRSFGLRISSEVQVPTALGFFRPIILIPAWALYELSGEELRAVVLHEFAHLDRRDDWTNLAQKFLRAIFFFHPAVLWVEKRLSLEREMACDDAVLERTKDAYGYARCLVSLAEKSFVRRTVALAQAAIGRARETSMRLARILDTHRPKASRVLRPVIGAVAGLVIVAFAVMPTFPKLVSFENSSEIASKFTPQINRAMVVPASLKLDGSLSSEMERGSRQDAQRELRPQPVASTHRPSFKSGELKAVGTGKAVRSTVVQTKLNEARQQMVVFTQTTDYYRHGAGIVGVTEWRLMVVSVPVAKAQPERAPNRT